MSALPQVLILLVEDSATDALLLREALAELNEFAHSLDHVGQLKDGFVRVQQGSYDVVLLDLGLPDSQGINTLLEFRSRAPDVPILVLTALDSAELGLMAIQKGAQDYLIKRDIQPALLGRTIRYAIERHQYALALAESEERFELAVTGAAAGLWDWDLRNDKVYLATRFKAILGYANGELGHEASLLREGIHPCDRERVLAQLTRHLEERQRFDVEYRMRNKSGGYCWVHACGQALWDRSGTAYRMVGWIMDISTRKQVEAELEESRHRLQLLANRQTNVLENERTRISREVHDELGQGMSGLKMDLHWLRTRLTQPLGPKVIATMQERIKEAEDLADKTIDSMQRIAMELRPSALDYLGLIPAIRDEARRFQTRAGLRMDLSLPDELVSLDTDVATTLFRIFQELLTNVARHARASSIAVRLVERDDLLVMEVADDGVGMPPGTLALSTSLGLLGMHERAAAHGGDIRFDSEIGKGTHVTVAIPIGTLPLAQSANA